MSGKGDRLTRREFVQGVGGAAAGLALGWPLLAQAGETKVARSRVVLARDPGILNAAGDIDAEGATSLLDRALTAFCDVEEPAACWRLWFGPEDVVGIKSNVWRNLPTPPALEETIRQRVIAAGVAPENVAIDDQGVLRNPVFTRATALVNIRPMRTHAWSGVGSLIKNYIMFTPDPQAYHPNSCADLGALWHLPAVKGKTRLCILVLLTPLFFGRGWHHFDPQYTWPYGGLLVGTDPVALDTIGLAILEAKRTEFFGAPEPIRPPAHHIPLAATRHGLGIADRDRIDLIRLGPREGALI